MAKMGRPTKQEQARNKKLGIKLTETEYNQVNHCAEILNLSRTDAIILGIKKLLEEFEI